MSSLLTLDSVSAARPDGTRLFSGLTLSLARERVGLVGRNGCGKSTLLHIVRGDARPASGTVKRMGSVGMLAQNWPPDLPVADILGVAEGLAVLSRIVAGEGSEADFETADWTLEARVEEALAKLGLSGEGLLARRVGSFSGGERVRIGLARLMIERPDLLLLDEPTNNLDAAGREAVAEVIRDWPGGVLIASHDRALLEGMDRIVELSPVGIRTVGGGWSSFAAIRDAERERAAEELERSQAGLKGAQREAQQRREAKDRRDKAGRAFAASGSAPKILLGAMAEKAENSGGQIGRLAAKALGEAEARLDAAREKVEITAPLTMDLPPSGLPSGAELLVMEDATLAVGALRLGPWSLTIKGPERVAIAGANGAGKSSLLRLASGAAEPASGSVRRAAGRIAMLDQHIGLLDPSSSVLENYRRLNPGRSIEQAHAACAHFAFRNRDALQLAGTLSGGERLRAGLACTLAGENPPWLLILDEPTNHLDIEAIEALEQALAGYDGALLVVSHDRAFLQAVGVTCELVL